MNIFPHLWYSLVASWAFVLGHRALLCWAVSKASQKGIGNKDALFWFMMLSKMKVKASKSSLLKQLNQALKNLSLQVDQSSERFCYALLFLAEDPKKHQVLLKLYPSLQMSTFAQTFFFSTLCHSKKFKDLPKNTQDNLFIPLFDMAKLELFTSLMEVDQKMMQKTNKFATNQHVYNLFLSLARNLPEKSFHHALSHTSLLAPSMTLLSMLPQTKEVCDILVRFHPKFVFQSLSQYSPNPKWQRFPFVPEAHLSLLAVRYPLLGEFYQQSCLEYEAQTQRQDILGELHQQKCSTQQKRRM